MAKETIVTFYNLENKMLQISYLPHLSEKEIIKDVKNTWGEDVLIVGFEYY